MTREVSFQRMRREFRPVLESRARMSMEKTVGLVVRQADFSESSRVVTLFTRDFGKIAALAKGAKRLKGPFEAALDLLTIVNIVLIRKSSGALDLLTEAKLQKRFTSGELERVYSGYYIAELLDGLTETSDPHPALFDAAILTLEQLESGLPVPLLVSHFESVLLRELGHLPVWDSCVQCEEEVTPQKRYVFRAGQGGLVCGACSADWGELETLQPGTLTVIRRLTDEQDTSWTRLNVSPQQWREIRPMLSAAISVLLGRRPKMLNYLRLTP